MAERTFKVTFYLLTVASNGLNSNDGIINGAIGNCSIQLGYCTID